MIEFCFFTHVQCVPFGCSLQFVAACHCKTLIGWKNFEVDVSTCNQMCYPVCTFFLEGKFAPWGGDWMSTSRQLRPSGLNMSGFLDASISVYWLVQHQSICYQLHNAHLNLQRVATSEWLPLCTSSIKTQVFALLHILCQLLGKTAYPGKQVLFTSFPLSIPYQYTLKSDLNSRILTMSFWFCSSIRNPCPPTSNHSCSKSRRD